MILADAAPTGAQWNGFWIVAAFLAFFLANVATVVTAVAMNRKQKREVTFGFIPASKDEFDKHVGSNKDEHNQLFAKLGGMERGCNLRMETMNTTFQTRMDSRLSEISKEAKSSSDGIHERINDVLKAVCRLEGKIEERDQR